MNNIPGHVDKFWNLYSNITKITSITSIPPLIGKNFDLPHLTFVFHTPPSIVRFADFIHTHTWHCTQLGIHIITHLSSNHIVIHVVIPFYQTMTHLEGGVGGMGAALVGD